MSRGNVAKALPTALQYDSRNRRLEEVKRAQHESHEGGCHTVVTPRVEVLDSRKLQSLFQRPKCRNQVQVL